MSGWAVPLPELLPQHHLHHYNYYDSYLAEGRDVVGGARLVGATLHLLGEGKVLQLRLNLRRRHGQVLVHQESWREERVRDMLATL